jgi:hypothetical protein
VYLAEEWCRRQEGGTLVLFLFLFNHVGVGVVIGRAIVKGICTITSYRMHKLEDQSLLICNQIVACRSERCFATSLTIRRAIVTHVVVRRTIVIKIIIRRTNF